MKRYFITGIGTDVGKTVVSAIVVEALGADYWKPIQAGDLAYGDSDRVREWVSNPSTRIHENSYRLQMPMSPHAAAAREGIRIELENVREPQTSNSLVIEGAGGLLVPLNERQTMRDLLQPGYRVLVVSRHYLGSINHTLLTLEALKRQGAEVAGVVFNGDENRETEEIIQALGGVQIIGRLDQEPFIDAAVIRRYAALFRNKLRSL